MTTSLVCEDFPTLTGRQDPHHLSAFPGSIELGEKAIILAGRARKKAMPWQRDAMHAILSTARDGMWTHPDCCLIVPRQNGKSLILVLRCLFGLYKLGERIIYTSQLWPTAEDAYKRLWAIIKSRPSLRNRVVKNTCSQGKGYIELESGAKIVFCTRSNDSGRGFDEVDLVIYDEAYNLTEGETAALGPTQMASSNPQTIYASSAVNAEQHPNGGVLAAIRQRGLGGEEGLYFAEFMAPDGMSRDEEETWKYANPSYGVIQTAPKIRKLMRGFSTPKGRKSFDVEVLGRGDWPVERERETWALTDKDQWMGLVDRAAQRVGTIALAVARAAEQWAIGAAQRTADGRIHVEVGYLRVASNPEIVALLSRAADALDPCVIATDSRSPAAVLEPLMDTAGLELVKSTTNQAQMACKGFFDDVEAALLGHTGQRAVEDALEVAGKRKLPQGDWVVDTSDGAVTAALSVLITARWALLTFESRAAGDSVAPAYPQQSSGFGGAWSTSQFDALAAAF
ncbi:hypothetical protein [Prescottella equi]|uniref:hypothetical protein n=1 Tax=Rhodococcus hoagii TaxID=43767 RepID=UPI000A11B8A9|nr:hypothetical protein [Prescottella equi]ORM18333.1 hypothetical protein A5N74_12060 [Prescottella equi]